MAAAGLVLLLGGSAGPRAVGTRPTATRPAGAIASTRPAEPGDRVPNPHADPQACADCHRQLGHEKEEMAGRSVDSLCLDCHDGRRARQERHPVGRPAKAGGVVVPPGWPLEAGKLGCATCHEVGKLSHEPWSPPDNPTWLRGYRRSEPLAFCARCHEDGPAHRRHNPHVMLAADGSPLEPACRFCHASPMDPRGSARRHQPDLVHREPTLCLACHQQHRDYFVPGHTGARVKPEMLKRLRVYGGASTTRPASADELRLPLADGVRIVCSTCHNPHQAGVFPAGSLLEAGGLGFADQGPGRRPSQSFRGLYKELCHACHEN